MNDFPNQVYIIDMTKLENLGSGKIEPRNNLKSRIICCNVEIKFIVQNLRKQMLTLIVNQQFQLEDGLVTDHKRGLGQGNVFTPVCLTTGGRGCHDVT